MSRPFIFTSCLVTAIFVCNSQIIAQQANEETALAVVSKTLESAIRLEIKDNLLHLKYPIDREEGQQLFSPLVTRLRSGGSSMSTNTWEVRAGGDESELSVIFAKGISNFVPSQMPDTIRFAIKENLKPFRELHFVQRHADLFCLASNPDSQQLVIIISIGNDPPTAYLLTPGENLAITLDTSTKTSLRDVRKLAQVGKLLSEFGLANDLAQFSEVLTREIRNQIVRDVGDERSFEALLDQLESDRFETREQAAKTVTEPTQPERVNHALAAR